MAKFSPLLSCHPLHALLEPTCPCSRLHVPELTLRALGLVPMLGCMQLALRIVRIKDDTTHQLYMSMLMGSTASMVMQYLDSVLLSRWSYEAQGPTSALGGQTKLRTRSGAAQHEGRRSADMSFSRLVFGWEETFRARSTRTP